MRNINNQFIKLLLIILLFGANAFGQTPQTLSPNRKIEREMRGGEKISYQIKAKKGEFIQARADQKGIDVTVKVFAPSDGDAPISIAVRDTPNGRFGAEDVSFVAPASGVYRIEISSTDDKAPAGKYELILAAPRAAPGEKDLLRAKTERIYAEAQRLRALDTPEAAKQSQAGYAEAAAGFHSLGDKRLEVYTLAGLTYFFVAPGEAEKALATINRALALTREIGDRRLEAGVLASVGEIYLQQKKTDEALDFFRQSAALAKANGNDDEEIFALRYIGDSFSKAEQWQKAIEQYNRIAALYEARADKDNLAQTLNIVGVLTSNSGDKKARSVFTSARRISFGKRKTAKAKRSL